ncbi:hypothetical protein SAMN04489712_103269 [Thermomonospora echinospora]|uniref:Uncharacterized protein n=1 Tax=Thermomonospora echinospora TaxID=1992 RepID=A0A1H5XIB5_9ACTN|nr:hypothetical protein [Thermomonospora echinospora]SEG11491.1 hypothetical protein SAMN04489712_103269 [Thermomonospora echinospora]
MRSAGPWPRYRRLLGLSMVAAAAGGLAVAALGGTGAAAVTVGAGLAGTVVPFAVAIVLVLHDIREQQRRIIDQLETQTRILHRAARLAGELTDDSW